MYSWKYSLFFKSTGYSLAVGYVLQHQEEYVKGKTSIRGLVRPIWRSMKLSCFQEVFPKCSCIVANIWQAKRKVNRTKYHLISFVNNKCKCQTSHPRFRVFEIEAIDQSERRTTRDAYNSFLFVTSAADGKVLKWSVKVFRRLRSIF